MPAKSIHPPRISRRLLLGATAAVAVQPARQPTKSSDVAALCTEWLTLDRKADELMLQWARLDAIVIRERASSPRILTSMADLDVQIDALLKDLDRCFAALGRSPADSLHSVAGKLAVAARMSSGEGGPVHSIVAEAVSALASHRCSVCGQLSVP